MNPKLREKLQIKIAKFAVQTFFNLRSFFQNLLAHKRFFQNKTRGNIAPIVRYISKRYRPVDCRIISKCSDHKGDPCCSILRYLDLGCWELAYICVAWPLDE